MEFERRGTGFGSSGGEVGGGNVVIVFVVEEVIGGDGFEFGGG